MIGLLDGLMKKTSSKMDADVSDFRATKKQIKDIGGQRIPVCNAGRPPKYTDGLVRDVEARVIAKYIGQGSDTGAVPIDMLLEEILDGVKEETKDWAVPHPYLAHIPQSSNFCKRWGLVRMRQFVSAPMNPETGVKNIVANWERFDKLVEASKKRGGPVVLLDVDETHLQRRYLWKSKDVARKQDPRRFRSVEAKLAKEDRASYTLLSGICAHRFFAFPMCLIGRVRRDEKWLPNILAAISADGLYASHATKGHGEIAFW